MDRMDCEQEVRIGIVLYGGVSLAIYINGVVQEFLRLVRATAPHPNNLGQTRFEAKGTEEVYRRLGRLLHPARKPGEPEDRKEPVRTRFVTDLISGSSAGGINGVFLGKALALNRSLDKLKDLWVKEGDIEALIHDKKSLDSLPPGFELQDPPPSLLNSRRMYYKLLRAFEGMDRAPGEGPGLVDELDLYVTTTDYHGQLVPIPLFDRQVWEKKHRSVFPFQYRARGEKVNDFQENNTPFLAFASRATSAFPFAFEPMKLLDVEIMPGTDSREEGWKKFYRDYDRWHELPAVPFPDRPLVDGGYLDNKPFSFVIQEMLERTADLPVDRKLVYVEPSPEAPERALPTNRRPDAIENAWAAVSELPRYESIREDLEKVVQRNREVSRVNGLIDSIRNALGIAQQAETQANATKLAPGQWQTLDTNELMRRFGSCYLAYHRLKIATLVDDLTGWLVRHYRVDRESREARDLRMLVDTWKEQEYGRPTEAGADDSYNQFLLDFDVRYRLRRLRHVLRVIDELRREPGVTLVSSQGELSGDPVALRAQLGDAAWHLRDALDFLRALHPAPEDLETLGALGDLKEALKGTAGSPLPAVLQKTAGVIATVAGRIRERYSAAFNVASRRVLDALDLEGAPGHAARVVRAYLREIYFDFETYDSSTFAILHDSNVRELDEVEVVRISPRDATALVDEDEEGEPKLRGTAIMNFGGFLDRQWRENDIMWGRLDGAERIITALLPDKADETLRNELIGKAHDCILNDELGDKPHILEATGGKTVSPRAALDIHRHVLARKPEPELAARSLARSTTVIGRVLEGIAGERRMTGRPGATLARVGQVAAGLVEVAVPRSLGETAFRYWISLAILVEIVAAVIGQFIGGSLQSWALKALGVTAGLYLAVLLIRDYMRYSDRLLTTLKTIASLVVVLLVAIGLMDVLSLWGSRGSWAGLPLPGLSGQSLVVMATGLAGLLALIVSAWMANRVRALEYSKGNRPGAPLLELEFVRTAEDIGKVAGDFWHSNRKTFRAVQEADQWFLSAYGAMFLGFGVVVWLAGHPVMGAAIALLGVAAAAADAIENKRIDVVLGESLEKLTSEPAASDRSLPVNIAGAATVKWICVCAAMLVAGGILAGMGEGTLRIAGWCAVATSVATVGALWVAGRRSWAVRLSQALMGLTLLLLSFVLLFRPGWVIESLTE